jgi:L-fuconolactonase
MRVDSHQHLWDTRARDYPWMDGPWADPIHGVFGPDEFWAATRSCGVDASVVVQATTDIDETLELLAIAARTPHVAGVVGWIDLAAVDVGEQLRRLREAPGGQKLVGIRHQVEDEPDPAWLLREAVQDGLRSVGAAGLAYDLLIRPHQLPAAVECVRRRPDVTFVLDHLGKPRIGGDDSAWSARLAELADQPNVAAKISGLVTEAAWQTWTPDQLLPYIDHALAVFGPDRLMFGSDWPVCTLAATYDQVVAVVDSALAALAPAEREAILALTAMRVYGLTSRPV